MVSSTPVPPTDLHRRVAGQLSDESNYEANGHFARESILSLLPPEWSWEGKRVLDFGCGPGRVLRQFGAEAQQAELHGCDMHEPSITWLRHHAAPRLQVFVNDELPPLPRQDCSFDLIWAVSVFTHLTDSWSRWLLELHRLLGDGGRLIATFHGQEDYPRHPIHDEPWREDLHGMNVLAPGTSWDVGGPAVFHSHWWLKAHWGRAFDIEEIRPSGFGRLTQGVLCLRKRDVALTPDDLERPEPGEPRELEAARHNVRQLSREATAVHKAYEHRAEAERITQELTEKLWAEKKKRAKLTKRLSAQKKKRAKLTRANRRLKARVRAMSKSRSWRLTRPLRSAARAVAWFRS